MSTQSRTLGAKESRLLSEAKAEGFSVLTTDDAREILGEEKVRLLLSRLSKNHCLLRFSKKI